ncbi:MAG: DNA primase [Candidatus Absconditicoccaceae bacterium]
MSNPIIDDILHSTDIVDIVGKYVPLKKAGSNFSGCCPFHNEKTPSFMVSPTKQIFKCFGCGKGGNVLTFMQEIEKIDFRDAVKELAKMQHIDLEKYDTSLKKNAAESDEKGKLKRIHTLAQNFFRENLQNHPEAQQYLQETRKLSPELIERFGIGYAPESYYELVQRLRTKGFNDNDILEASLAKRNANGEIYAFFRNRITFPIADTMGNIVGFSARVLNPEDKPKYLNSAEHKAFEKSKILYGLNLAKNAIREQEKLIIVEGQMDVLGLAKLDMPIGVATSGTALTEDHVKTLKRYTENIYLLFDNDSAGQQATKRALKLFYQQNLFPKIIKLPTEQKDVDDLANTPEGKEVFNHCLNSAQDGFITVYQDLRSQLDMSSPIDKQKLINTLFEMILSVNSLTIQEHYKSLLAEELGFAFEILDAQFKRYKNTDGKFYATQSSQKNSQEHEHYQLERELLFVALFYQEHLNTYLGNNAASQGLLYFIQLLTKADPESLLNQAIHGEIPAEQKQKIEELTLRRDNQLEALTTPEKKYQMILQIILPTLQKMLQFILKNPKIPANLKAELLAERKNL